MVAIGIGTGWAKIGVDFALMCVSFVITGAWFCMLREESVTELTFGCGLFDLLYELNEFFD